MAETDNEKQNVPDAARDQVVVRHPSGQSEKVSAPEYEEKPIRIGRELDNDIVLTDPRASRYHVEIRRAANGDLEIKDLDSANGVFMGVNRIKANIWEKIGAGQTVQMGETRIFWEKAASGQSTVAMKPSERQAIAAATATAAKPAPTPKPQPQEKKEEKSSMLPLLIGIGALVLLLLLGGVAAFFLLGGSEEAPQVAEATEAPAAAEETDATPAADRGEGSDLNQQALDSAPTETPTPSGPQLAIPVVNFRSSEVRPIFLRALPSTDRALLVVDVRLQNVGNIPYTVEIEDFSLRDESGQVYEEAGGTTTEEGLTRLGVKDRFDGLNLTPGGSVPETLIFELEPDEYNFELFYEPADLDPITLNLGIVDVERELAVALGTPVEEEETPETLAAIEEEEDATPTPEPTPTATRPAAIPAPQVVPRSALAGTIAYPVFNGNDYDIYLGDVENGTTQFYRGNASQPDFNVDGSRIAFHSWSGESRGLVTMDVSGANAALIANFVEDQLPTWTADSDEVIFLSRRTGNRASELYVTDASTELGDARVIGEGEYPSIGPTGQLAFKGWGNTAFGLRVGSETMGDLQTVTNADEDTAPSLSPDGQRVVFMSRREGGSWEIYIANVDGSELQQLTSDEADDGLPTWSPDGNAIAFVSNRGGPWAVWAMTPEGDGKRQVFTMEGSPDGQVGPDTYASRGWAEERISWTAADLAPAE